MKIHFLGIYNTRSKITGPVSFVIDDILAVDAGSLATGLTFEEQLKIKAILLSHGHYDHIADIPAYFFNNNDRATKVFGSRKTFDILSSHLADGIIYPNFTEPSDFMAVPSLDFHTLEPYKTINIEDFTVLAVPMEHTLDELGFEISDANNRSIFYTGDTGATLTAAWQYVNPHILIVEVTMPDRLEELAIKARHLCPQLLKDELIKFRENKGYLPQVVPIHMSPRHEAEIIQEMKNISGELGLNVVYAKEGQVLYF